MNDLENEYFNGLHITQIPPKTVLRCMPIELVLVQYKNPDGILEDRIVLKAGDNAVYLDNNVAQQPIKGYLLAGIKKLMNSKESTDGNIVESI